MKIKIIVGDLVNFLNLVCGEYKTRDGKVERFVNDLKVKAKDNALYAQVISRDHDAYIRLKYNCNVMEEGKLLIGDVNEFMIFLGRYDSSNEVLVYTTDKNITIERENPNKKSYIAIADERNIRSSEGTMQLREQIKIEDSFVQFGSSKLDSIVYFNAKNMKEAIEDGEAIGQRLYPIMLSSDKMKVLVGTEREGGIMNIIPTERIICSNGPISSTFEKGQHLFKNLVGEVRLFLAKNSPFFLTQQTKVLQIEALISPSIVREEVADVQSPAFVQQQPAVQSSENKEEGNAQTEQLHPTTDFSG